MIGGGGLGCVVVTSMGGTGAEKVESTVGSVRMPGAVSVNVLPSVPTGNKIEVNVYVIMERGGPGYVMTVVWYSVVTPGRRLTVGFGVSVRKLDNMLVSVVVSVRKLGTGETEFGPPSGPPGVDRATGRPPDDKSEILADEITVGKLVFGLMALI